MTDKQIIKLKPMEDLNEKIIKEKGNTKCIFYADDICRKGDKTRDCVNCARVEYHSLYSLNWNNQARLQKIIKQKEQECEELKEKVKKYGEINEQETKDYAELKAENERLKKEIRLYDCIDKWGTEQCRCACRCLSNEFCDAAEEKMKNIKQTLAEINRMAENTYCLTNTTNKDMANFAKQIFQKISEVEK